MSQPIKATIPANKVAQVTREMDAAGERYKALPVKPTDLTEARKLFSQMVMTTGASAAAIYLEVVYADISNTGEPYWMWR